MRGISPAWPSGLAPDLAGLFDGVMSEDRFAHHPEPNAVLRGGQLDGIRVKADSPKPITLKGGELLFVYRPIGEMDNEYPTLAVYVFSHTEDR